MTEEERHAGHVKARNLDRLEGDDAMMTFSLFYAAALAGGANAKGAEREADQAIALLKKRFT